MFIVKIDSVDVVYKVFPFTTNKNDAVIVEVTMEQDITCCLDPVPDRHGCTFAAIPIHGDGYKVRLLSTSCFMLQPNCFILTHTHVELALSSAHLSASL
jgi:hypothetical protein